MRARSTRFALMVQIVLGASCAVLAHGGNAAACSFIPPLLHEVDPTEQAVDDLPPTPPGDIVSNTRRTLGTVCSSDGFRCVASSCGDEASIELLFSPAMDDRSSAEQIGYRLDVISGVLPATVLRAAQIGAPNGLLFLVGYEDMPALDAMLTLTAIDAAGNESLPSEPFHLAFSGCTTTVFGDGCLEDLPAGTEPTLEVLGTPQAAAAAPPVVETMVVQADDIAMSEATDASGGSSCSMGPQQGPRRLGLPVWLLLGLAGLFTRRYGR